MEVWLPTTSRFDDITIKRVDLELIVATVFVSGGDGSESTRAELYLKKEAENGGVKIDRETLAPEFDSIRKLEDWIAEQEEFERKTAILERNPVMASRARSYVCPDAITDYMKAETEDGNTYWMIFIESSLVGALGPTIHGESDIDVIVEASWEETVTE